jgi:hypothetical protein
MDLAGEAGLRYMTHICRLAVDPALAPETRRSASLLAETLEAALESRSSLQPGDVRFGTPSLDQVPAAERLLFVNQFALGVGSDQAPIVAMGTEPAERIDHPEELAFHCLYPVLILCGSRMDVLRRIGRGSAWEQTLRRPWDAPRRPYHLNPDDLLEVARRGGHTWSVLAKVVVPEEGAWRTLLGAQSLGPGLGEHVYQIDRSALPARRQEAGLPPGPERVAFMTEVVIPALRPHASVLLLHGFGGGLWRHWQPRDYAIIAAFLGLPAGQSFELNWDRVGRESLGWMENDGRLAVFARALSGRISGAYVVAVRRLVRGHLTRRTTPLGKSEELGGT